MAVVKVWPQLGVGCCTPKPRKLRLDSVMIAPAKPNVAATTTGPMTLGRMWRKIMRWVGTPNATAAVTKSRLRKVRNWPRTRRVMPGQPKMPMMIMMLKILGGKTDATVMINKKVGKHMIMSVIRMITLSTVPPR